MTLAITGSRHIIVSHNYKKNITFPSKHNIGDNERIHFKRNMFLKLMQPIKETQSQKDGTRRFLTNHFVPIKRYHPPGDRRRREPLHLWMMSDFFSVFFFVLLHLALDGSGGSSGGSGGGQDDRRIQMQINLAAIDSLSFYLFTGAAVERDLKGEAAAPSTATVHRPPRHPGPHQAHSCAVFVSRNVDVSAHTLRGISWNS